MKLLIITQSVDEKDPVLGFFCRWIEEFAKHGEKIEVICLREGVHHLPGNVRVHSLGKEKGARNPFVYAVRFKLLAWKLRHEYDAVFVHMNPEYLIIAGPLWRLLGKRAGLWYLHRAVNLRLRLGVFFANVVFTASPESMRLATAKKRVVGHGIDLDALVPAAPPATDRTIELITIGRLSPIKHVDTLIEACGLLRKRGVNAVLTVVGSPAGSAGERYAQTLKALVGERGLDDRIRFLGSVPHDALLELFKKAHLFVHASATGSLDKAALEPLAAGVPVITANPELAAAGVRAIVGVERTPEAFADAVEQAVRDRLWESLATREEARSYIYRVHSLATLIPRILAELGSPA